MEHHASKEERLERLERAEARIKECQNKAKPWPNDMTAEEMVIAAKDQRLGDDVNI